MVTRQLYDPAGFAKEGMARLRGGFASLCVLEAPEAMAAYRKARAAFLRTLPNGEPPERRIFDEMDEAVLSVATEAYEAGLAAGTHWEALRRSLVPAVMPCPRCYGIGSLGDIPGSMTGSETPCHECEGAGTVETTAGG